MINPSDLKHAEYNPRIMHEDAEDALSKSMETFNDISGITYNKQTGNIVGGHHRWDNLVNEHSIKKLKFKKIDNTDRYLINSKKGGREIFTGYILRVVDWDETKEKAANITANSKAVRGEFTGELQNVLASIREGFGEDMLFEELRLDAMEIKLELLDEVEKKKPVKKSETMISGGGDKYITVKLELSPELSDRFHDMLNRFKCLDESVEQSLETIVTYIENTPDNDIIKPLKKRSARKRRK